MKLERPHLLRDYQKMFDHIYGTVNRKRYSDADMILRLIEEIAEAMELSRKDARQKFAIQLPRIFSWLNGVANRFNVDLQDALWEKYPGVCSYCLRNKDCICGTEHPVIPQKEEFLRRYRREYVGRAPFSLREHQELHARLYKWQNARILLQQVAAHLAEEAGEISREFRHKNLSQLRLELADVASWIFALATRLELTPFDDFVWHQYPYECERCHHSTCSCQRDSKISP